MPLKPSALALRCACGRPPVAVITADLLGGVVIITIGACALHEPEDNAKAYEMIRALLAGIAKASVPVAGKVSGRGRRRSRRD